MIETRDLTKAYGKLVAVNKLNLKVQRGHIHGFVGPNGAGKSTTMKMLIGAVKRKDGDGFINGYPIGSMEAKRSTGFSPERPCFYWDMATWDYLIYMACLSGMKIDAAEKRVKELLNWVELGHSYKLRTKELSAGMKQRLSLAQAMIHQPQLLILDEPTANLDPDGRISFKEKLRELRNELNITIFISSHILPELEQIIDTVTIINQGRTVVEDSLLHLRQRVMPNSYVLKTSNNEPIITALQSEAYVQEIYVDSDGVIHLTGQDPALLQKRVTEAIARAGVIIELFSRERVDLQDIYHQLTRKE